MFGIKYYHLGPKGPQKCKNDNSKWCGYVEHFPSLESARRAEERMKRQEALQQGNERPSQTPPAEDQEWIASVSGEGDIFDYDFKLGWTDKPRTLARDFGDKVQNHYQYYGKLPQQVNWRAEWYYHAGPQNKKIRMTISHSTHLNAVERKLESKWVLLLLDENFAHGRNFQKVVEEPETQLLKTVEQLFNLGFGWLTSYWMRDTSFDEASKEVSELEASLVEDFQRICEAAESIRVKGNNSSETVNYFSLTEENNLTAEVDYNMTAFHSFHLSKALKSHPDFQNRVPDVTLTVSDRHREYGTAWALQRRDGQWFVEQTHADGWRTVSDCPSPQDALNVVYHAVLTEVTPQDEEAALRKGRYAYSLMEQVEKILADHARAIHT